MGHLDLRPWNVKLNGSSSKATYSHHLVPDDFISSWKGAHVHFFDFTDDHKRGFNDHSGSSDSALWNLQHTNRLDRSTDGLKDADWRSLAVAR